MAFSHEKNTTSGYSQHLWHLPYEQYYHSLKHMFIHAYTYMNSIYFKVAK